MADRFSDEQATRIVAAIQTRTERKLKDGATIASTWGTVAEISADGKTAGAYLYGETASDYVSGGFRIPETTYLTVGDVVKVAINYQTGERWIDEVNVPTVYKRVVIDLNTGQVLVGTGVDPATTPLLTDAPDPLSVDTLNVGAFINLQSDTEIVWATDTNLLRQSAGVLRTDGTLSVGVDIDVTGVISMLDFGSLRLSNPLAGMLRVDSNGDTVVSRFMLESTSGQLNSINAQVSGDTSARIQLRGDASVTAVNMSDGTTFDVRLARTAATTVKLNQNGSGPILLILGDTDSGSDLATTEFTIGIERAWTFKQTGSGATAELSLAPDVDTKIFSIRPNDLATSVMSVLAANDDTGYVNLSQGWRVSNFLTPAQITANTDNYSPTGWIAGISILRINTDAARNLTGIAGGAAGRVVLLVNTGAFTITLVHDATSTAANRFLCPGSANFSLTANKSVWLWYDTTSSRWRVVGG